MSPVQAAFQLMRQGRLGEAEQVLHPARGSAEGDHLLALIRGRQDRYEDAHDLMARSVEKAPNKPDFWVNFANLALDLGAAHQAEIRARRALELAPGFPPAADTWLRAVLEQGKFEAAEGFTRSLQPTPNTVRYLSRALRGLRRYADAESVCADALRLEPKHPSLQMEHAIVLEKMGQVDQAIAIFAALEAAGVKDAALNLHWAATESGRDNLLGALAVLDRGLARTPFHFRLHQARAQMAQLCHEDKPLRLIATALDQKPCDAALLRLLAGMLRQAGEGARGSEQIELARRLGPEDKALLLIQVEHQDECGDPEGAVALLASHPQPVSCHRLGLTAPAHAYLRIGQPERALPFINALIALDPHDQFALAYQWIAQRQSGEHIESSKLVRTFELEPPPTGLSLSEFLVELLRVLRALHTDAATPLGQSVFGGTQTRQTLLESTNPIIRAFLLALEKPLASYESEMARMDCASLSGRGVGRRRLSGCWSIRLPQGGGHSNHLHPQGWISSAFYVAVPDAPPRQGWLKFGEPRFPMPGCDPDHWIQPRPGLLALFPSFLWHGVEPIRTSNGERVTIAFDAVPAL